MKDKAFSLFIGCIAVLMFGLFINKQEQINNTTAFINNLPSEMVDYIVDILDLDLSNLRDRDKLKAYYLQNFPQLEDLAYEYNWH